MHGANASGRPFTGDAAGALWYRTLFDAGFASAPVSSSREDGLTLHDCRITNAVRCLPPNNTPVAAEINRCNDYIAAELDRACVVLALGGLAHRAVVRALRGRQNTTPFRGGAEYLISDAGPVLIDSYHCSRYNTNTGRLTPAQLAAVVARARVRVDGARIAGAGLPTTQSASS